MNFKVPESVLVVVHTPALDVLLLDRAAHPGYWQSVTGSREGNESFVETARREVAEETGIDAPLADFQDWRLSNRFEIFAEWRHRYGPGVTHNTEHVFSLCIQEAMPPSLHADEHRGWQWLPWHEAAAACFSWTNRDAILILGEAARTSAP